MENKGNSLI